MVYYKQEGFIFLFSSMFVCMHAYSISKLLILHANLADLLKTHCIFGGQATSKGRNKLTVYPVDLKNMGK